MSCFNCYSSRRSNAQIIDEAIERGQKLRNAIVRSIHGPTDYDEKYVKFHQILKPDDAKIRAFLQGEAMSPDDERDTLRTLRSMSAHDLCKITDRSFDHVSCEETYVKYKELTRNVQEKCESNLDLKFVDCLKINVNSVLLNESGEKRVFETTRDKSAGVTFYLEYQIPEALAKIHKKEYAGNNVRFCARKGTSQAVMFKQVSTHDINSLDTNDWENTEINFRLSFRHFRTKKSVLLGIATFSFSSFEVSKNFTCNQELTLRLNENNPIVMGGLKVSIQLGCGRLYYGKVLIDAIANNNKENFTAIASDDFHSTDSDDTDKLILNHYLHDAKAPQPDIPKLKLVSSKTNLSNRELVSRPPLLKTGLSSRAQSLKSNPKPVSSRRSAQKSVSVQYSERSQVLPTEEGLNREQTLKAVLFGFVCVSEAAFNREVLNSYVNCQMFALDEFCTSKAAAFDSNPVYGFFQRIPLVFDDDFLLKLRENFMVVEFFERAQKDFLIGLTKIPLHQFYLAYRNPVVTKYLAESQLPVIGSDGWETIHNHQNGETVGKAQILVAIGTKVQIDNLESERGFRQGVVKARNSNKTDASTQSVVMQLPCDDPAPEPQVRSTADLLESLQKALSVDKVEHDSSVDFFKAQVLIHSALHLPSRRKCKAKKSKSRTAKHEDILPSAYVTFEDHKGELKMTNVVPKTTSPKWDFSCEVGLPVSYLTDTQKLLIFKVWRKSTNTTLTPNLQADHVLGFAAVDLTVLSAGLPSVQGWFNVSDLSKKSNGQINVNVTPLESIAKHHSQRCCSSPSPTGDASSLPTLDSIPFETNELLGRALKRKFSELDEITQRLRLRLSKVTNDDSDTSNDDVAEEFEHDINTICVEDDFDTLDFEKEARKLNFGQEKDDEGLLQKDAQFTDGHLVETRQKIDHMLEKLTLFSGEASSRYVSGCSTSFDAESLLAELDLSSRPNLHSSASFGREMALKFGELFERSKPEGGDT